MRNFKLRIIILAILLLGAIFSLYTVWLEEGGGILTVSFLNIGQGDATFIEGPNGNQILIDGGPGRSILRELSAVMPFYDRSIDVVVATHADQDHVGGLPDVLNKYNVNIFMETEVAGESSSYEELEKMIVEKESIGKIKKILARRGMKVDLGGGAVLQILFPDRDPSGMETNTSSIVARLVYGKNEFLFTGDSPKAIEEYLVSLEKNLKEGHLQECQGQPLNCPGPKGLPLTLQSDVLKAGHHGSKTSTSAEFVSAVSPEFAVISVGKDNRYGHPNQETLDALTNFSAKILRTDQLGRIIFQSDGVNLEITP